MKPLNRDLRIERILRKLEPTYFELINDSAKHAGHVENLGPAGFTGETHYKVSITSPLFEGKSRIDRQRMVMDLLKDEFTSGLHALEIKAKATNEI